MASASPALPASRPTGFDFRRTHEYPILLGDSLRNNSDARDQLLSLRYNWQPSTGLRDLPGTLKKTSLGYSLALGNDVADSNNTYYYKGHSRPEAGDTVSYALVFNKQKSAFVLEKMTKSIDVNVDEGPSIRYEAAKDLRQLPKPSKYVKPIATGDANGNVDSEVADQSNPFDFRHFLADAKEATEKVALPTGGNTPLAGGRTPVGGFPSPVPGPARLGSTTPLVKPTASSSTSLQKKRKVEGEKRERANSSLTQRATKKAESRTKEIRSKERISDSDDEYNDTIVAANQAPGITNTTAATTSTTTSTDKTNSHQSGQSPHIVLNDGGLEIDMGSPPREDSERKRGRVDLGAFRAPTDHSTLARSKNRAPKEQPKPKTPDSEPEEDADIEELELGSPRSHHISVAASRSASVVEPPQVSATYSKPEDVRAPTNQAVYNECNDDDDDDDLAAEFEAALDEADQDASAGHNAYGLGISDAAPENEESEVSEEE